MKRSALFIVLMLAGNAFAYNEDHRPFGPEAWPRIPLVEMPLAKDTGEPGGKPARFAFESARDPQARLDVVLDGRDCRVGLSIGGREILSKAPFSDFAEFGGQIKASAADLNQDGIADYVVSHWLGGCGLASGYYDLAFLLSTGETYKPTAISALWPDPGDYLLINGKPSLLHTTFHEVEKCTDGKSHNFWVYNILAIDGGEIKVANERLPGFPKTVWYSFAPGHDETDLLTDEQKTELHADSLKQIFWAASNQSPATKEKEQTP